MNNQPSVDEQETAKFAKLAAHWWDKHGELRTLHDINPTRIEFIEQFCSFKDQYILDVGCGGGILCEPMAEKKGQVTGIDAEITAINSAKLHAERQGLSIDYQCTAIENFSAPPVDIITCMEMLEHVQNPELIIQHCARLLKPNGYLFLSTINRTITAYATAVVAAEYIFNLIPKQTHDYKKFIKPAELAAIVRAVGLTVVDIKGLAYQPLSRKASLQNSVAVNYLMACVKN